MAYDYGTSGAWENYLYLFSSDLVLDIDDQNVGSDLLRRVFGSFYYYATTDNNRETVRSNPYYTVSVEDLKGTDIYRIEPRNCPQIQYAAANHSRIEVINNAVDTANIKIPFRLYADKDNNNVRGDHHWKQFFEGGLYAGETLPQRMDSSKVFYDASIAFAFPMGYKKIKAYEHTNTPIPYYKPTFNLSSNYYEYNHEVQKYQDWASFRGGCTFVIIGSVGTIID